MEPRLKAAILLAAGVGDILYPLFYKTRPLPMLMIHGDQDPMVPFADLGLAADALAQAGFDTFTHVMKGTGHGISPDGLGAALQFLKTNLKP